MVEILARCGRCLSVMRRYSVHRRALLKSRRFDRNYFIMRIHRTTFSRPRSPHLLPPSDEIHPCSTYFYTSFYRHLSCDVRRVQHESHYPLWRVRYRLSPRYGLLCFIQFVAEIQSRSPCQKKPCPPSSYISRAFACCCRRGREYSLIPRHYRLFRNLFHHHHGCDVVYRVSRGIGYGNVLDLQSEQTSAFMETDKELAFETHQENQRSEKTTGHILC